MSLIKNIEIIQGDSSDIYTFASTSFPDFSDVNWVGAAVIRQSTIDGTVLLTIPLTKSTDNTQFVFAINPTDSASLPVGRLYIAIEIKNMALNFRREVVQTVLKVIASGVENV